MKTIKAWAVVCDDEMCGRADLDGPSIYWTKKKADARNLNTLLGIKGIKIVRVEIREIRPLRKSRGK